MTGYLVVLGLGAGLWLAAKVVEVAAEAVGALMKLVIWLALVGLVLAMAGGL